MGLSDAVCLDFDLGVRALKRWADRREAATHQVPDNQPERKQRMKTVPTYPTLAAVLGLGTSDAPVAPAVIAADAATAQGLAAAMAGGDIDWEAFGLT